MRILPKKALNIHQWNFLKYENDDFETQKVKNLKIYFNVHIKILLRIANQHLGNLMLVTWLKYC